MANIYVGNIPYSTSSEEIHDLFEPYGEVRSVNLIIDRETGRPKGFCFVDMDASGSRKAIEALHQTELAGRKIVVSEAKPRLTNPSSQKPRAYAGARRY